MPDRDINFHSVADVDGRIIECVRFDAAEEGGNPRDFDDTLKFSHARNIIARKIWVRGGKENAIDMNRECAAIRVEDAMLFGGDQCAVVIKGGSQDITLSRVTIALVEPASACDIELGGWSDQSTAMTRRVTLNEVRRLDGCPVRIVLGHAERPLILGGNCRILFWRSVGMKVFWLARWLQTKIQKRP